MRVRKRALIMVDIRGAADVLDQYGKAARSDLQDEREAAELERARKGVNRFPPPGGN